MRVSKWGNSLAVRIPKDVAKALELEEGDRVSLRPAGPNAYDVYREPRPDELIEELRKFRGVMPANYKFDRDEANAR